MKERFLRKSTKQNGITLIALVVTIVVLLILAGVSIAMLAGEDGIISQAQNAKDKTKEAEVEEKVRLAINASRINGYGNIDPTTLQTELEKLGWNGDVTAGLPTTGTINGMKVTISANGDVTESESTGGNGGIIVLPKEPGLYDSENILLASWDELIEMGLNVQVDYSDKYSDSNYYGDTEGSLYYLLSNDNNLEEKGTKLIIGNVEKIGSSALSNCYNLTDIIIPDGVVSIGDYAFKWSYGLMNVDIPDTVRYIGEYAFYQCRKLINANIPSGITNIEAKVFTDCESLKNITIPNGVVNIGEDAFNGCNSITKIVIPEGVVKIGKGAFKRCESLTDIEISSTVTSIGSEVLNYCQELINIKVSPDNEKYDSRDNCNAIIANNNLLYGCKGTTIPSSVTTIEVKAFAGTGVINITIPSSITSIKNSAFYECNQLTSIVIPDSVKSIGTYAFYMCTNLKSVTLLAGITELSSHIFDRCRALTSISIPVSVNKIGLYAFYDCRELTNITIPSSISYIGSYSFSLCNKLMNVTIESSTIANGITDSSVNGNLIANATTLYIKEEIGEISSYIKDNYKKEVETDKKGYVKYVKETI